MYLRIHTITTPMLSHIDTELLACYTELRALGRLGANGSEMFSPLVALVNSSNDMNRYPAFLKKRALKFIDEVQSIDYDAAAFRRDGRNTGWQLAHAKVAGVSRQLKGAKFLALPAQVKAMIEGVQRAAAPYVSNNSKEVGDFIALLNSLGRILESGDYTGAGMEKFQDLKALGRILTGLKKE